MNKNLILLGAPGSGKGTQSAKLSGLGFEHVSTGNLLRGEISKKSVLGIKIKDVMESGELVSDDLVEDLLSSNLELESVNYIFDGYPRNLEQAKTLTKILGEYKSVAVYFELDTEKLVERLESRRMTKDGRFIYNTQTNPPKVDGICDITGEMLIQRDDDQERVVRNRMEIFKSTIDPVLDYYKSSGLLISVRADREVNEVFDEILSKIQ